MANLSWVGFVKLFIMRFAPESQKLGEGTDLVQMRHTHPIEAYVRNLIAQINATPKMDKISRKCIFLGQVVKVDGGCLVQVPKAFEDMARIIKISKSIEVDGLKGKLGSASQQSG